FVKPRAAAHHAIGADGGTAGVMERALLVVVRSVTIGAPLPDVALHVVQAPRVRWVLVAAIWLLEGRPLRGVAVGLVAVEIGLLRRQGRALPEGGLGPGTTSVFPLRLGRQPIHPPGSLLTLEGRQAAAKVLGLEPVDALDREIRAAAVRLRKGRGVGDGAAHDLLELLLGDRRGLHVIGARQR